MEPKSKSMSMKQRKEIVAKLVEQFSENEKFYTGKDFVESECRSKFIDILLECLKWDVKNEKGARHDKQEVITEDRVIIDGQVKHPDYTLCYGGERKIYVEAKQPSVDLKDNPEPALQVRRYAYTSKMPIAILTDFQEFAIYDTRIKPKPTDTAATARIEYLTYKQYVEHFEELYDKISWDAVDLGKFDTYWENARDKKGTASVDNDILAMIEKWRTILAEDIALHNEEIDEFNLTSCVQKIIDRVLFLRICEDKEIEEHGTLKKIAEQKAEIYSKLRNLFKAANDKFNAGLFATDSFLDSLNVQDKTLCTIINELYYPICQYEFSVLPVEILGSIYEQFLGKIIRFTRKTKSGHSVEIIEKPEVQKAGGVYYTPPYIVKYIVKQTIGKKIEGKTPEEISKMRFVDPACGSGSFLIGAYQYLLDWHLEYYTSNKVKYEKQNKIYKDSITQDYKLSIEEKRAILLNNIYGVDIDAQAVEVTKLSLFLKLLENEGRSLGKNGQTQLFRSSDMQTKILPSMMNNIKCGNSLIASDYYADKNLLDFGIADQRKVNAFDWEKQFEQIFANGGFDCVIGNPPYFNIQTMGAKNPEVDYIKSKYSEVWQDKSDILFYFFYKAIQISKDSIGFIISNAFLFSDKAQKLRAKILSDGRLRHIINFEEFMVFNAGITTCISLFDRSKKSFTAKVLKGKNHSENDVTEYINNEKNSFSVKLKDGEPFALVDSKIDALNIKIDGNHKILSEICVLGKGMETAADSVFLFNEYPKQFPKEYIKERVTGKNMDSYIIYPEHIYVLYFEDAEEFKDLPESIQDYLKENKKILSDRATVKNEGRVWWRYSRPMHKEFYHLPKLYCSRRAFKNTFCYDDSFDYLGFSNMTVIFETNPDFNIKYILTLLNSSVLNWRYKSIGKQTGGGSFEYFPNGVGKLPIPSISKEQQEPLVKLADQMLAAKKQLATFKGSDSDRKFLEERIRLIDSQINSAVYKLYGLTKEEITVVEGK